MDSKLGVITYATGTGSQFILVIPDARMVIPADKHGCRQISRR